MNANKFIVLLILLVIIKPDVISQGLYNNSFEEWYINGLDQHPVGWTSSNDFSLPIGFPGVSIHYKAMDGLYAAQIITANIGFAGAPYAGFIVNGKMNVSGHYDIDSIYKAGEPFTFRPDALSGYYKYQSDAMIEDWAQAFVILKKYDSLNQKVDTIGYGENVLLNPSSEYRYFTVDIDYYIEDVLPDSIVVAFFSTYPRYPISGGKLWIDDIMLEYATGIELEILPQESKVLFDSYNDILSFNGDIPEYYHIYSTDGSEVLNGFRKRQIDVSLLKDGLYIIVANSGGELIHEKFVKH